MRWTRDLAILLALGSLLFAALTTARAQEPTPEATTSSFCDAASIPGGETRLIGAVEVTLPPGTYNITLPPPGPGEQNFVVCHKETGATLNMSALDCEEIHREAPTPEAEAVIDAIVASCHIAPTPTAEPPQPFACPGEVIEGGQTVTIAGSIEVTLPPGHFVASVDEVNVARICNADEEYDVYLRLADCSVPTISPPDDPHAEIKHAIEASCVALFPPPTVYPPADSPATIQPPNTGDAGLLAR